MALDDASFAEIPAKALALLAPLRNQPGIEVSLDESIARVRWQRGQSAVVQRLLAAPGARLFEQVDGQWRLVGQALPAFDLDTGGSFMPLARALTPGRLDLQPDPPPGRPPLTLTLSRSDRVRETTAAIYDLAALATWAEMAGTDELHSCLAARLGQRVLLLGTCLPWFEGCSRWWGERVLCPLGFELTPALPQAVLCEALGLRDGEFALAGENGVEVLPSGALARLSRASLRLAVKELEPKAP
ncbi:hypothetical protein EDM80_12395 [bacterium]|nr:MAG: hypothetical protein EDM80_12395 [bacterium]RIK61978.1 MAG: hypothetical protein DCC64_11850 [Planctomycetota bacterium]